MPAFKFDGEMTFQFMLKEIGKRTRQPSEISLNT